SRYIPDATWSQHRSLSRKIAVFELHISAFATPTDNLINESQKREGFQDTTKGLRIPSVRRRSLLLDAARRLVHEPRLAPPIRCAEGLLVGLAPRCERQRVHAVHRLGRVDRPLLLPLEDHGGFSTSAAARSPLSIAPCTVPGRTTCVASPAK